METESLVPQKTASPHHNVLFISRHKPSEFDSLKKDPSLLMRKLQEEVKSIFSSMMFLNKYEGGTVSDGILTLLAATIGTGILMIPNSMAASGIVWSVLQMIFCGFLSYYSLITMVKCASRLNVYSYQDLALKTYGHWCRQVVNLSSFFANWGSAILYLKLISELFAVSTSIFMGDVMPIWMTDPESKVLPILIATVFVLPLSIAKELKALRYFCILNICFVLFFCFVVFYQGFDYQPLWKSFSNVKMFTIAGFSTTFPSGVFAYMSHTNLLDVYKELQNPSLEKMTKIIKSTVMFVLITYVFVGIIGYATFSSNIELLSSPKISNGIILLAYGHTLGGNQRPYPALVVVSMITMSISIVISQPFNIKPAKDGLKNFISPSSKASKDDSTESTSQRFIYTAMTLYSCVFVAIYSESIQMIMNVLGSSFFSLICFILPSLLYLKVYRSEINRTEKICHCLMIFVNIIFAVWNTSENIVESFESK